MAVRTSLSMAINGVAISGNPIPSTPCIPPAKASMTTVRIIVVVSEKSMCPFARSAVLAGGRDCKVDRRRH